MLGGAAACCAVGRACGRRRQQQRSRAGAPPQKKAKVRPKGKAQKNLNPQNLIRIELSFFLINERNQYRDRNYLTTYTSTYIIRISTVEVSVNHIHNFISSLFTVQNDICYRIITLFKLLLAFIDIYVTYKCISQHYILPYKLYVYNI